jgi:sulfur-oxidizing protein SoxY
MEASQGYSAVGDDRIAASKEMRMNPIRRSLLAAVAAIVLKPFAALAAAWNKDGFGAKSAGDALKTLGATDPRPSKELVIEAPEIAENGAVVPIEITSNIPGTTSLAVLIDKNPFPLVGKFDFMADALPFVKLNVKVGETSEVRVVAEAAGKHYVATREVKVTIGGCGG